MDNIKLCFVLSSDLSQQNVEDNFSKNYQIVYKPIISFLYAHPECKFTFSFTGDQLSWYKKNYPEFLKLINELSNRKQVEVLGGGYYNPIFPLLYPVDRSGQIEMMSSELRRTVGKRPRGLLLCASSWDPSLVSCFQTCGMEYVILDSSLIPPSKQSFLPLIVSDKGKSLNIISNFRNFIPDESFTPHEYIENIVKTIHERVKDDEYSRDNPDRIATVILGKKLLGKLLLDGWFEDFINTLQTEFSESVELSLPLTCKKNSSQFVPAYIPAGIGEDFAQWAIKPYDLVDHNDNFPVTIYDFLRTYPRQQALYNRMIYVSMILNQSHGDKMRKKAAREELWKSQNGEAFICTPYGLVANSKRRMEAYKCLAEAEKFVRETDEFHDSITSFDYNCDGLNEYICRMEQYDACIGLKGGLVFELDVMKNTGNYADNLTRIDRFDGCTDKYERGLFVDHLFDNEEFESYKNQQPSNSGVFSSAKYNQVSFNSSRHEIHLEVTDLFSTLKQPVRLKKNYSITENGFMVQYILKNESPIALSAKLVIESNFFLPDDRFVYNLETVSDTKRVELDATTQKSSVVDNISVAQVIDASNEISFIFEPNEVSSLAYSQISFMRPDRFGNSVAAGKTLVLSLCWDVCLAAGMEMEKTINFVIVSHKKRKKNKNTSN